MPAKPAPLIGLDPAIRRGGRLLRPVTSRRGRSHSRATPQRTDLPRRGYDHDALPTDRRERLVDSLICLICMVIVRLLKLSTQCLDHAAYHALCGPPGRSKISRIMPRSVHPILTVDIAYRQPWPARRGAGSGRVGGHEGRHRCARPGRVRWHRRVRPGRRHRQRHGPGPLAPDGAAALGRRDRPGDRHRDRPLARRRVHGSRCTRRRSGCARSTPACSAARPAAASTGIPVRA
jgi:hypothetical protein